MRDTRLDARIREELAIALHDSRVTLPELSPLERAEAERVIACVRVAELALDHEDIRERADRAEHRLRHIAETVLAWMDRPSTGAHEELARVCRAVLAEAA